jgi:hypothetical protein
MRIILGIALLSIGVSFCFGQSDNLKFAASVSGESRISLVKSSVDIPSWHEKAFWPIYENYVTDNEVAALNHYRSLEKLTTVNRTTTVDEAVHDAEQMLATRNDVLRVRRQYYQEMANALNGIISLQFIQTELLLDMMETSKVYEDSPWRKFRFHANALSENQRKTAKRNTMTAALLLTKDEAEWFWKIYDQYEEQCDAILGEDYTMISLYAGEPSDFTPALAKRLGSDLLVLVDREAKLKEEYFYKIRNSISANLAARFLAWEDYYSLVSKMHAWADAP